MRASVALRTNRWIAQRWYRDTNFRFPIFQFFRFHQEQHKFSAFHLIDRSSSTQQQQQHRLSVQLIQLASNSCGGCARLPKPGSGWHGRRRNAWRRGGVPLLCGLPLSSLVTSASKGATAILREKQRAKKPPRKDYWIDDQIGHHHRHVLCNVHPSELSLLLLLCVPPGTAPEQRTRESNFSAGQLLLLLVRTSSDPHDFYFEVVDRASENVDALTMRAAAAAAAAVLKPQCEMLLGP